MPDVRGKYVPPATDQGSFSCPHCGALAKQFWFSVYLEEMEKNTLPWIVTADDAKDLLKNLGTNEQNKELVELVKRKSTSIPFLHKESKKWVGYCLENCFVSTCYSCDGVAIWVYNRLVWPKQPLTASPNPDLPADIRQDYDEASSILDLSPRGAAALLRLSIQKLCIHLGERGKKIDEDIAALVRKGLYQLP